MANAIPLKIVTGTPQQLASTDIVQADGIAPRSGTTLGIGSDAATTVINMNGVSVTTINIGNSTTQVNVPGTMTVTTTATFNGDTVIGDAITDSLTVTAGILNNLTFRKEAAHSVLVQTSTTATAAGGALTITSGTGATSGNGGLATFSAGSGGTTGVGGGVAVTAGAGGSTSGNGGQITLTGGTVTSGVPGNVIVTTTATASGTSGTDRPILKMTQAAGTAVHFVGTSDPSSVGPLDGGATPSEGSIYHRTTAAAGQLWLKTGASATAWTQLATGGTPTLQQAYTAGNSISVVTGSGTISFTNTTDTTDTLTVTRTFAGGGRSLVVTTGASVTGTAAFVNNVGTGSALQVQDNGTDVLVISAAGAMTSTPTSGQAFSVTTAGAGGISLTSAAASSFATSTGALTLTSAVAATWSTLAGALTVNGVGGINLQGNGTTAVVVSAAGTAVTVQAGATLTTTSTGNINLPNNGSARFQIETVAVSANVTSANLGTLTAGSTSNADALHTHTTVTGSQLVLTGFDTTTNTLGDGDLGYLTTTANRVQKAIATSLAASIVFGANEGVAGSMTIQGTIENQNVESTITVAAGDRLYVSAAEAGKVTNVAPVTVGQVVAPVGIARTGNGGAGVDVPMILQIGTPILL